MELLVELEEHSVGLEPVMRPDGGEQAYRLRKAARAVVRDGQGRIALLHVTAKGYHKLPGGGVEKGEDLSAALRREVLEEAGVELAVDGELGMTIEYRNAHGLLQVSYCYFGRMVGEAAGTDFTEEEKEAGFRLLWVAPHEAVSLLEQDRPADYLGAFIRVRDKAFLRRYVGMMA
ncbi:NUDIX hydrolase [Gorillibacterium sp. sgz5001074]|uniref:NUDIX hydrolase n=1 Tax=Gorillibacterium sp. sgz5001074 TaxID=3446695 RepID=UPI003F6747B2